MQPKIYTFDEHNISSEKIDTHAYYVIHKLRKNGHIAYLVGGSVRDLLLKKKPKDFDISTSAKPEEIKKIFRNCILIGRRFRLAHIRFGRKVIEVATFRSGDTEEKELVIRDNIWGSEEEDVIRRDFTINGLYYDPETQTVIDYVGGFDDIKKGLIRTIGKPHLRFIQDPVRMIRLIKFRARYNFEIDEKTYLALKESKREIINSSPARILEELFRMLESGASKKFFSLLHIHGILEELLPFISYFLKSKERAVKLLSLLDKADETNRQNFPTTIKRSVLCSCLVFPLFDNYLKTEYLNTHPHIHLGKLAEEASIMINEIFSPFIHMPRRLKAEIISILVNQYRFIPLLETKKRKKIKIPKDSFFSLALNFLYLRSKINNDLVFVYEKWENAYKSLKKRTRKH